MLTIIVSWMLASIEPGRRLPPTLTFCNAPIVIHYSLVPEWKVTAFTQKKFQVGQSTNFENWQNREQNHQNLELTPIQVANTCVRARMSASSSVMRIDACLTEGHRPWQIAFRPVFTFFDSCVGKFLHYEITKTPTIERPYYVAFVQSMPNIRCKATTLTELEQQLVVKYKEYLLRLVEESDLFKLEPIEQEPDWEVPPIYRGPIAKQRFAF